MSTWKDTAEPTILVTSEDLTQYRDSYKNGNKQSFKDFLKNSLGLPKAQEVKIELDDNLENLDLSGLDLSGIIAVRKNITNVSFTGANLSGAKFIGGQIDAVFSSARLYGTWFKHIEFSERASFKNIFIDKNTNLVKGPLLTHEDWIETDSDKWGSILNDRQKREIDSAKSLLKLLSTRTSSEVDTLKLGGNVLKKIARSFAASLSPTYRPDTDLANTDQAAKLCRSRPDDSVAIRKLNEISEIYRIGIEVVVSEKLGKRKSWYGEAHPLTTTLLTVIQSDKFLEQHFLTTDMSTLGMLLDEIILDIRPFIDANKEDLVERFNVSATKITVDEKIRAWQQKIRYERRPEHLVELGKAIDAPPSPLTEYDRLFNLARDSAKRTKDNLRELFPDSYSPHKLSSWPVLSGDELEKSLETKALGLVIVKHLIAAGAGGAGFAAGTTAASAIGIPGPLTTYIGAATGGFTALVARDYLLSSKHEWLLNGQLGDRLLELGMLAERAPGLGDAAVASIAATAILWNPIAGPLTGLTGAALVSAMNMRTTWNLIQEEKKKSFPERLNPGSKAFQNLLQQNLTTTPLQLFFKVCKAVAIGTVAVAAVGAITAACMVGFGTPLAPVAASLSINLVAGAVVAASALAFVAPKYIGSFKARFKRAPTPSKSDPIILTDVRSPEVQRTIDEPTRPAPIFHQAEPRKHTLPKPARRSHAEGIKPRVKRTKKPKQSHRKAVAESAKEGVSRSKKQ